MKLTNYDLRILWIIIIVTCIVFYLNLYKNKKTMGCFKNKSIKNKSIILLITLIHIIIVVFSIFGWLFFNKKILLIYLILQICLFLHWITNDWKCKLSQIINNICNFKDSLLFFDNSFLLIELLNYIGINKFNHYKYSSNSYLFMYFHITVFCIVIYKLQK